MQKQITLSTILLSQFLLLSLFLISSMAADSSSSSEAKVHIVYTERPEGQDPEQHHISTLASVLGSEDAAKEALIYSYKHAASGFSAKLTPQQVDELSTCEGGRPSPVTASISKQCGLFYAPPNNRYLGCSSHPYKTIL